MRQKDEVWWWVIGRWWDNNRETDWLWVRQVKMFDGLGSQAGANGLRVGGDRGMAWFHQLAVTSWASSRSWNWQRLCFLRSLEVFDPEDVILEYFSSCMWSDVIYECSIKESHDATLVDMRRLPCHPKKGQDNTAQWKQRKQQFNSIWSILHEYKVPQKQRYAQERSSKGLAAEI